MFKHLKTSFSVTNAEGLRAACYVTCLGARIKTAGEDNLAKKVLYKNFDMGKRSRWFEENCTNPNIKVLARLIADLRVRFKVRKLFHRNPKICYRGFGQAAVPSKSRLGRQKGLTAV